ncbi:PDGLE domain-containing protein [Thermogladius sp.]|uniref:PDGLE domain-containing protein n=1 Tax=Thermogladius sp. TaxID=2023064 RepID=UPI003D0B1B23
MKKSVLLLVVLLLVSPVFGVYLASLVGYHEPLDIAGEKLNLTDISDEVNWTFLKDYTVPGLPEWLGYIVSGVLGVALIYSIGLLLRKVAERKK